MIGFRILLVDDDPDAAAVIGEYLRLSGFLTEHASNGAEGYARLVERGADLVLLDLQMPVMDGFQTLAEIRRNTTLADLPVIVLSSFDRPNLKIKALELGADDYAVKTIDRAELQARVRAALRRSARLQRIGRALEGDLQEIGLPTLLQTLELGAKSATVSFPDAGGEIALTNGRIDTARVGPASGDEAIFRLLLLARGRFEIAFHDAPPPDRQNPASGTKIQTLLFRLAPRLDEIQSVLNSLPPLDLPPAPDPRQHNPQPPTPVPSLRRLLLTAPGSVETLIQSLPLQGPDAAMTA